MSLETLAPPGWGYRPGAPMMQCDGDNLPPLPMLPLIKGKKHRRQCVRDAISQARIDPITITPLHLRHRYGIGIDEAAYIVLMASRGAS